MLVVLLVASCMVYVYTNMQDNTASKSDHVSTCLRGLLCIIPRSSKDLTVELSLLRSVSREYAAFVVSWQT